MNGSDPDWLVQARRAGLVISERPHVVVANLETPAPRTRTLKVRLVEPSFTMPGTWVIPLHLTPGDNARGQRGKIGRAGHERRVTARHLAAHLVYLVPFAMAAQRGEAVTVTFTRLGRLLDSDGLQGACKYVRDTVALFLGVDDGPTGAVSWDYHQERSAQFGVRVSLAMAQD